MDWQETAAIELILKRHKKKHWTRKCFLLLISGRSQSLFLPALIYIFIQIFSAAAVVVYVITSLCE